MNIDINNEVDKKLAKAYPENILRSLEYGKLGYLGMNITSTNKDDIAFKIYFDGEYGEKQYKKSRTSEILNELFDKKLIKFVEFVLAKEKIDHTRYDVKLRSKKGILDEILAFIDKKTDFFNKYKNEILVLSNMNQGINENDKISALNTIGIIEDRNSKIKKLKCYWLTQYRDLDKDNNKEYYLNFLKNTSNKEFTELLPIAETLINNCKANFRMIGADYTKERVEKRKIYLDTPQNLYEGLLETFKQDKKLTNKIKLIQDWHNKHVEFYCEGFAISKNSKNEIAINFYFKLQMDKLRDIINKRLKRKI